MRTFCILIIAAAMLMSLPLPASANADSGTIRLHIHYGQWSTGWLGGRIEEELNRSLETAVRQAVLDQAGINVSTGLVARFVPDVVPESGGSNYGIECRWYPDGGRSGFNLGLALEKTSMRLFFPLIESRIDVGEYALIQAEANGEYTMNPLSLHVSLGWDIPVSRYVRPFIRAGFGAASVKALENGMVRYDYTGGIEIMNVPIAEINGEDSMNLVEFNELMKQAGEEFLLPGFVPFAQAELGILISPAPGIGFTASAGFWDGFLWRMGLSLVLF
jgi:hypothetical protein